MRKKNYKGEALQEQIGKGLNESHPLVKSKLVGCFLTDDEKEEFKAACDILGVKQAEVFKIAIKETIKLSKEANGSNQK